MKLPLILSLATSLLAANAVALPNQIPQPLLGELKDSRQDVRPHDLHLAEDGAERTPGQRRLRLAEDGADRLLERQTRGRG